jgi:hypothetical protein
MPKTVWEIKVKDLDIKFENQWNFHLEIRETLTVNGVVVSELLKSTKNSIRDQITGSHSVIVVVNNVSHKIAVRVGSKWHGFRIGCHIYVNDELIGGDIHSRLLFV